MTGIYRASNAPHDPPLRTPLQQLRYDWGGAYEIEEWRARRRDGLGDWFEAGTREDLEALITADYSVLPVPRDAAP